MMLLFLILYGDSVTIPVSFSDVFESHMLIQLSLISYN